MSENIESELLARCRTGDAAAWNAVFDQHYPAAGQFVFQLSPGFTREDVEKICTETFRAVIQYIDSFQEANRFQPWLFRVAAKAARDHRGSRQTGKPAAGSMAIVRKAIDRLDESSREMIELHYFGDLSYKDIGDLLSLTSDTVGLRLSKCLEELEIILGEYVSKKEPPPILPIEYCEELLKSYAKQRREDAGTPLEMSLAIREKLQAEVSKVAKNTALSPQRQGLLWDRARPGFVFALFLVLLITAYSVWLRVHTSKPHEFTNQSRQPLITLPDIPKSPPVKLANPRSKDREGTMSVAPIQATVSRRYARVTAATSQALEKVLLSFEVGRNSDTLWIVDADGSVYADSAVRGTSFRAIGTNRTLNQSVVFEGKLVAESDPAEAQGKTPVGSDQIQGRVFVGTNDGIDVVAKPAEK